MYWYSTDSNNPNTSYTQIYNNTSYNNVACVWGKNYTYTYTKSDGSSATGRGTNKLRIVLKVSSGSTYIRLTHIGAITHASYGGRVGYMSRGIDDPVYRNFTPNSNNVFTLGTSDKKWKGVYATNFYGIATHVSCTATTDNVTRPIVLTNTSNQLYYTTKATINYYTGNITAPTFTGTATKVACNVASSNNDRPIVGTNKSNELYYTTKATVNWETGNIIAPTFTGKLIGDADTLDGVHADGLLTNVDSTIANNLSITVGGTTKTIADLIATRIATSPTTITSTTDDTTSKWGVLGTSIHYYSTAGQLTD